jgi:hypothetical protein
VRSVICDEERCMLTDDSAGSWGWMVGECFMLADDSAGSRGWMVGDLWDVWTDDR